MLFYKGKLFYGVGFVFMFEKGYCLISGCFLGLDVIGEVMFFWF